MLPDIKSVASTCIQAGELEEARRLLRQATKDRKQDAELWFLLGQVETQLANPDAALPCFTQATVLKPDSAMAYFHRGLVQITQHQLNEAVESLEKCLAIDPGLTIAHLKICSIYGQLGQQEKARQHIESVLRQEPRNAQALIIYARIQMLFGQMDAAQEYFRQALEQQPGVAIAVAGLAGLYAKKGEFHLALELLEPFLGRDTPPRAIAIIFSDICQYADKCGEAVELLERMLADAQTPAHNQRDILVALAKLYDRLQQYDDAFACISKANRMKQVEVDMAEFTSQVDDFITSWNADFNARLPVASVQIGRVQPVFIVGMPRSGTTLAEQILASHPAVYGAGELREIGTIIRQLPATIGADAGYPECLDYADKNTMDELAGKYLRGLTSLAGGGYRLVSDKMPTNFWNVGLIKQLFPGAAIIHCSRNPLDTCISCYFTDFGEGNLHSFDLANMGVYYRQYQKIMRHWRDTLGIQMLEFPYEDVVRDPESWSRRLIDYCGLEWDNACLSPHRNRRDIATASFLQVRQRVYTTSVDRWKHYEAHLGPLHKALED